MKSLDEVLCQVVVEFPDAFSSASDRFVDRSSIAYGCCAIA